MLPKIKGGCQILEEDLILLSKYIEGDVVEIGTGFGCSAIYLSKYCSRISTIEWNPNLHPVILENIKNYPNIVLLKGIAEDIEKTWVKKVSVIFYDGRHDWEVIEPVYNIWNRFLINGGIFALHGAEYPGTQKLIKDYNLQIVDQEKSMIITRK